MFAVTLDDSVGGSIKCITVPIGKKLEIFSNDIKNRPHGSDGYLVVRLWLFKDDVDIIKNASNAYFRFDQLLITVKGGDAYPQVVPQRIKIDWVIDLQGRAHPFRRS